MLRVFMLLEQLKNPMVFYPNYAAVYVYHLVFFGTVSGFPKNTEIGKSWILSVLKISENDSREDQPEIIELSSDEDQIPDIIEISSDEQGQIPEIIDEEVLFEKGQIAVSRDRTPEAANIKLNL
ncbi:18233_t:CDS:2 [Gigaspora rosea]|nr:18233_t:CDS:2 [Gigaspora rosea]